jgi:hypothetical protein
MFWGVTPCSLLDCHIFRKNLPLYSTQKKEDAVSFETLPICKKRQCHLSEDTSLQGTGSYCGSCIDLPKNLTFFHVKKFIIVTTKAHYRTLS